MLFADDSAIAAHTAEEIQVLVDRFKSAARSFSLPINLVPLSRKLVVPLVLPCYIRINDENLVECKNFVDLGSTILRFS